MNRNQFYTGIGSRKTPSHILELMQMVARKLEKEGWVMRSGGAGGADLAFGNAVMLPESKEIYLPWKGFAPDGIYQYDQALWAEAEKIASDPNVYPLWSSFNHADHALDKKGAAIRKLQTRNVFQVLGGDLRTPSSFILCWTPDGAINREQWRRGVTGGTGTAINLASGRNIPVFNLQRPDHLARIQKYLGIKAVNEPATLELAL